MDRPRSDSDLAIWLRAWLLLAAGFAAGLLVGRCMPPTIGPNTNDHIRIEGQIRVGPPVSPAPAQAGDPFKRRCPNCGFDNGMNARKCVKCGWLLNNLEPAP